MNRLERWTAEGMCGLILGLSTILCLLVSPIAAVGHLGGWLFWKLEEKPKDA